jgi:hypothetical protein
MLDGSRTQSSQINEDSLVENAHCFSIQIPKDKPELRRPNE